MRFGVEIILGNSPIPSESDNAISLSYSLRWLGLMYLYLNICYYLRKYREKWQQISNHVDMPFKRRVPEREGISEYPFPIDWGMNSFTAMKEAKSEIVVWIITLLIVLTPPIVLCVSLKLLTFYSSPTAQAPFASASASTTQQ